MEREPPFELASLKRDWIEGVRGGLFSERVAAWLEDLKATRPGPVLLAEEDGLEFTAVFMAAVYLRRPVVLGNPRWGSVEWSAVAEQLKPARVVGIAPLEVGGAVSDLSAGAILIPTGGTSGGVRFAHHDWATLRVAAEGWLTFAGAGVERVFCVLPLYHVSGLMQWVRSFIGSIQFAMGTWADIPHFGGGVKQGVVVSLVATQLERLLKDAAAVEALRGMEAIYMGGGPMREETAERARAEKLPLVLSYGMTETGAMVAALGVEAFMAGAFHAGRALCHASLSIIDGAGKICAPGVVGRIRVASKALFYGYHAVRAEGLRDGGFLTDDAGFLDKEGQLHVVGRIDRLIQSGGEKVDPLEVEAAMLQVAGVEAALVLGQADAEWVERVVAFYVAESDLDLSLPLAGLLTAHKRPKLILRVAALPLNASGKVDSVKVAALLRAVQ